MKSKQVTYQTRIKADAKLDEILTMYSTHLSMVCRNLFKDLISNKKINELKKEYIKKYKITARQFNSCRLEVEGKIKSYNELRKNRISSLKQKIKFLEKKIPKYKNLKKIHQKKRRLFNLKTKLQNLEKETKPKLCFGSKKLFNKQFYLEENGFKNHLDWKKTWQENRNNSFFLVGSKDESSGNQTCQIQKKDKKFSITLRLPNKLSNIGKTIIIDDITFSYDKTKIIACIENNLKRKVLQKQKNLSYKLFGQSICYRFKKDKKGWRIFITLDLFEPLWISKKENGVIGIDINSDHLAVVETDRFFNPINSKRVPLNLYGKNKNQALAIIGDASAKIVKDSITSKKPIVLEKLDFQRKKTTLKEANTKHSRMLSSFSYNAIINTIKSKAFRSQIEIFEVNPAYTSVIGRVKFAKRYGLSTHLAAALVIGRRSMKCSENPPRSLVKIPDKKGSMRAFFLPVRNRKKHLWSFWGKVFGILKAVDAPHFQATNSRSSNTPLPIEIEILENCERNSHTLTVDKTARSTSLKKSLLHV
ncbi:MAG: hypothetical protein KR126chlam4_01355 [Candidatus Anoxychlamydiales bacterium]|nr:hypothetical protein [Candidatus Anoxychlamydiales bacterium]NGX41514.1 hypothetical protein [Candidatus Anoxychlamydiales bacterium]